MAHADELLRQAGVIEADSGLYDSKNLAVVHHLNAALRANAIYQRDVDYIVRDGEVIIVDEFTGRTLAGRRWSDGLHQAVEAKEGVPIQRENQTLATVTFQNLFRMYKKLAGMTGTADTEAYEFQHIYGLEVVVIPTHKPMIRKDNPDMVFLGQDGQVQRRRRGHQGLPQARPAGAGRHHLDRGVGAAGRACCKRARFRTKYSTPSSTSARRTSSRRPVRRARSPSPPTWPVAAPTSCSAAASRRRWPTLARGRQRGRSPARSRANGRSATTRCWRPAACTSSVPSGTSRAASTTSCAAVPVARATRAHRASTCRCRTTCCASSPATGSAAGCACSA